MKKTLLALAVVSILTTGCYTSRRVVGDDLKGGIANPALWLTVPIDTVMAPFQIPKWLNDDSDPWTPWDPDEMYEEYQYSNWAKGTDSF